MDFLWCPSLNFSPWSFCQWQYQNFMSDFSLWWLFFVEACLLSGNHRFAEWRLFMAFFLKEGVWERIREDEEANNSAPSSVRKSLLNPDTGISRVDIPVTEVLKRVTSRDTWESFLQISFFFSLLILFYWVWVPLESLGGNLWWCEVMSGEVSLCLFQEKELLFFPLS